MDRAELKDQLAKFLCKDDGQTWEQAGSGIMSIHGTDNDQEIYIDQADSILKFLSSIDVLKE